ncbi:MULTISPECIES: carboxymuconolactone decarboxylase family protein [unclassified Paracoccus (in: a-proteobacteria)]|uniref:carboxymuconolactone decarboxylase family protein n=1 Tax=unclassified Paracoccus (in: a-proteobacteria) TaxID=2688777 RepID=UPI0021E1AA65|nr:MULTISPECIES: carboxymuconolactone decarboxylase family protein [unclassified Paracoccus (in: a-proteobacteria)]UXU75019.1 carboxymuconolactone decarboxylase family protein [Paracoccus sp. SMMA_5]UXU80922.1 carboxymuconolactone decarboxylase family protein [Paracoccus sp. SMMA_5_TC]
MNVQQKLAEVNARAVALHKADPQTMTAFRGVMTAANRAGRLGAATKELVAVAVAIGRGCEDCILFHTSAAKQHGASRDELVEVLAVAIEMSGGPGTVYAGKALAAFDAL